MSKTVPVWFDARHVGDITAGKDGEISFTYTEKWLATPGAFPLSLTMPLNKRTYPSEMILPWLANLLPEGEQLSSLARLLGIAHADIVSFLKEIGGDTAGALSFEIPSERTKWIYTPLTELYHTDDHQSALAAHIEDLQRRPLLIGQEGVRLSLAGGQKKSPLAVFDSNGVPVIRLPRNGDVLAIPRYGAPSTIILKPDNPNFPGITENETYCLRLARSVGITSSEATILPAGSRSAICVLRYDRRNSRTGALQRVHQEDFAQANGVLPNRKYERGNFPGIDLATLLRTGRHLPPADRLSLLDQLIFKILVADTDAHAKNYSLLLPVGSPPHLAPLYDVLTALLWPHITQYFAQNIAGKKCKPGDVASRHWDAISKVAGYRLTDVRKRVGELSDGIAINRIRVTEEVASLAGSIGGYVEKAAELIEENRLRIIGQL